MLKLFHNDMSSCAQKVRFVLSEKNLEWQSQELNLRRGDHLQPEFLKINPKGLVPTLQHDDDILVESNIIIEYLDEAFPEKPLLPDSPIDRAKVRWWMRKLDEGLHLEVIALSFAIAFRHQLIEALGTGEALEEHFSRIRDPYIREVQRQVVQDGIESPRVSQAIKEFDKLLKELDQVLSEHTWIVGDQLTLADIAYCPYVTRLEHLGLQDLWANKPHVADWYERIKATSGYQRGLADWFNSKYMELMSKAGEASWPSLSRLVEVS